MATKRVTITIEVDLDAYIREYDGLDDDAAEYAKAIVIADIAQRLDSVGGWAKVVTATKARYA